jgi:hypothetical protein
MSKKLFLIFTMLCFVALIVAIGTAQEEKAAEKKEAPKHEYVGIKVCKLCHTKDGVYPSWEKTPHANAWAEIDSVKPGADKQKVCEGCHATGTTAKGELLTNVECEACHGPGSDYKSLKIMKDLKLAKENGLIIPDSATCVKCHDKSKAPKEYHAAMAEKFAFSKMKAKGVHAMPSTEEKKEETSE